MHSIDVENPENQLSSSTCSGSCGYTACDYGNPLPDLGRVTPIIHGDVPIAPTQWLPFRHGH